LSHLQTGLNKVAQEAKRLNGIERREGGGERGEGGRRRGRRGRRERREERGVEVQSRKGSTVSNLNLSHLQTGLNKAQEAKRLKGIEREEGGRREEGEGRGGEGEASKKKGYWSTRGDF
jgi:hypothetical protein